MKTLIIKWKCILEVVFVNGHYDHDHNGLASTNKWEILYENYKKIYDYMNDINHNEEYSDMFIE